MPTEERHAWGGGSWDQGTPAVEYAPGGPGPARHGASAGGAARVTDAATPAGSDARGIAARGSTEFRRSLRRAPHDATPSAHNGQHADGAAASSGPYDDGQAASGDYDAGGGWEDDDPMDGGGEAADSGHTAADGAAPAEATRKRRAPPGERNQRLRKELRRSLAGGAQNPNP